MNINPFSWSFRQQMLFGFVCCASLLAFALYAQTQMLLMPCPLCILQRVAFVVMGFFFLIAGLHAPKGSAGRKVYAVLTFMTAGAGAYTAGYHLWLQQLPPDQVPLCGSLGIEYLVELEGPLGALRKIFSGSGECAKVDWTFLGLSMPGWTLIWYLALGFSALYAGWRKR
jgi:protein dithiol:quinone oxidoreductase